MGPVVSPFNLLFPIKVVKISLESISSAMKLHLIVLSVFVTSGMYIIGTVVKLDCSKNSIRIVIGILTGDFLGRFLMSSVK